MSEPEYDAERLAVIAARREEVERRVAPIIAAIERQEALEAAPLETVSLLREISATLRRIEEHLDG